MAAFSQQVCVSGACQKRHSVYRGQAAVLFLVLMVQWHVHLPCLDQTKQETYIETSYEFYNTTESRIWTMACKLLSVKVLYGVIPTSFMVSSGLSCSTIA